ncbi:MAG: hypothetical protein JNM69_42410 [Archangium sp.]|nr:hypothetical protein [Archangium sp.]
MVGVLLLALAASPELPFEAPGARVLAVGQTYDITSAPAPTVAKALVVWVAQGRMGIDKPCIYASRVQPGGGVDDPEGLLVSQPFGRDPSVAWVPSMSAWVVAWELDGQTLLRVVRPDGTFDPATAQPVTLGQGRAPKVAAGSTLYAVTAEATQPRAWLVQPPASPSPAFALSSAMLRYASPVRSAFASDPNATLLSSWVEGSTLMMGRSVVVSGTLLTTLVPQVVGAARVDLDATLTGPVVPTMAYRLSDGGSGSQHVLLGTTSVTLDAGVGQTDNASMVELGDGTLVLTSTQTDGQALGWRVFADGGFTGLGAVTSGVNRVTIASFLPTATAQLLLASTYNNGALAQPVSVALQPAGLPVQLSRSRAGHRFAQVAPTNGGAVAVWQRLTLAEAEAVAWRVWADGGHALAPEVVDTASRFDTLSLCSVAGGGAALLSGSRLRTLDANGAWSPWVTLPRPLREGTVTTDRAGRVLVTGLLPVGTDDEGWVLRQEASGQFTERLLFPLNSPKPVRPKLALSRDGGFGLAIINPDQQVWATRLTADLVALDDGGVLVSPVTSVDPFVVSDEAGGFLVVYTDPFDVIVRRVVGLTVSGETRVLTGEWDVGSVIEVPGGAAVVASSRATADVVTLFLTVDGGAVSATSQTLVSGGSFTNGAGLAVGQEALTWVFGRYDADAGAATTRSVVASRNVGAACTWGWQCQSGSCANTGFCRPTSTPIDGGLPEVDAGVADAGVVDAGVVDAGVVDAGVADAGVADAGVVDAGVVDAGVVDAGVVDAGVVDAGLGDAGSGDAGGFDGGSDAGEGDAGAAAPDAGSTSRQVSYRAGCDCQSGAGPWLLSALAFLATARRRREKR